MFFVANIHEDDVALPTFLNPKPDDLRARLDRAVQKIESRAPGGTEELTYLGGAALPLLLPTLDKYGPRTRAEIARGLSPLALRMGLQDLSGVSAEAASGAWRQFWDERSLDFTPSYAKRIVGRYVSHPSDDRAREIRVLDTFVLGELVAAIRRNEDEETEKKLIALAGGIAGEGFLKEVLASEGASNEVRKKAASWWRLRRSTYQVLEGGERLTAIVTETRYGTWLTSFLYSDVGSKREGIAERFLGSVGKSLGLTALALSGGWILALLLALLTNDETKRRGRVVFFFASFLSFSPLVIGALFFGASSGTRSFVRFVLLVLLATARMLPLLSRSIREELFGACFTGERALGYSLPMAFLRSSTLRWSAASLEVVHQEFTILFFVNAALEVQLGLGGMGPAFAEAMVTIDAAYLAAVIMFVAGVGILLGGMRDTLLERLDPRKSEAVRLKAPSLSS